MNEVGKRCTPPGIAATLLSVLLFLTHPSFASAAESSTPKTTSILDNLELKLELYRHEKLAEVKLEAAGSPVPFTTDGCSGGLSIGWNYLSKHIEHIKEIHGDLPPWESCCVAHDRAYHTGGPKESNPEESFEARRVADEDLRQCVTETAIDRADELSEQYDLSAKEVERIYAVIGGLMHRAVRLGGVPCSGMPWRWGYGWPECE